jgi:uncharacterized repeat protein (TIGR01451 family)
MKSKLYRPPGLILKTGVMALLVMTLAWLPQANAAVTADTWIENIATVTWQDSTNVVNPAYTARDNTRVRVLLVTSAVTLRGRPTDLATGDTAVVPPVQSVLSGTTATYVYSLTATANGDDVYSFAGTGIDAVGNVDGTETVAWQLLAANGSTTVGSPNPGNVTLGAAVVLNVVNNTTLEFPGGSLGGFSDGDIVVINGIDYRIAPGGVTVGTAPDFGLGNSEVLGSLVLEANDDRDDGTGSPGTGTTPTFTVAGPGLVSPGDIVGEQQLFQVTVTGVVDVPPPNGTVNHDVVLTNTGAQVTERQDVTTTFTPLPTVSISKGVRNVTAGDVAFTATSTGNPGDILEYQLTITNSGSTAEAVVVRDPVPAYTTLVTFDSATSYGSATPGTAAAGDFFAQANDNGVSGFGPIDLTVGTGADEHIDIASGDYNVSFPGELTFYVGDDSVNGSTATTGGDIPDGGTFTILYRVQIDGP